MRPLSTNIAAMAEEGVKKRTFRKYSYRGVDLDQLLDMKTDALVELFHARARRRFQRGLNRNCHTLIKKLRKVRIHTSGGMACRLLSSGCRCPKQHDGTCKTLPTGEEGGWR